MRRKSSNCWVECRDPIDLMSYALKMEIGLCWYQKGQKQGDLQSY